MPQQRPGTDMVRSAKAAVAKVSDVFVRALGTMPNHRSVQVAAKDRQHRS
jgi:hypothetical protein